MDLLKNGCRRHGILAALVLGVAAIAVLFGFEVLLIRGLGLPGILSATAIRFILGALMILLLLKLEVSEKLGFTGKGLGKSILLAWPFFLLLPAFWHFRLSLPMFRTKGLTGAGCWLKLFL